MNDGDLRILRIDSWECQELKLRLIVHFRTEEDSIFPKVKQVLSAEDLSKIGEAYSSAYSSLERPPSRIVNRV